MRVTQDGRTAGSAPQWTSMVLDTLARHRVPVTFFLVGAQVRRHADVVRDRLAGHEAGNHVEREFPDDPVGHSRRTVVDVRPGTIVLGHDVGAARRLVALRCLPDMIGGLRARGYTFVTVSALLGAGVPDTPTR
ncbi:polysaccharide deacetylase family protein [Micromonospora sp. WMMD1155]|uniref:polysaccharide deacetylase family protein n=1 Tax=Micromonospora sp. WMMD1155 TaxID=3016094 RepID=UPI00249B511D|nr:polysaccharide deacetylase family protein [Micromonospora sp. WMMD1155]WFE52061.1 polysaccharide deacetylase family protein [Micromonospora sp. WMMD1155]